MTVPSPSPAARPWTTSALLALLAVLLLLGSAWAYARIRSPFPYYGTAYTPPVAAQPFQGTDHTGQPYTFTPGSTGRTTAVFFGFTHCPNICPLSLAYLEKARQALTPQERQQLDIVLVSVDPARDTPERLGAYVEFFGTATGVHIPEPALARTAQAYGVAYQQVKLDGGAGYQVNHTPATYLVDGSGTLRVLWDYTQLTQVDRVVRDLRHVLENPLP
ncbi:SCO family protein [Deinococcus deserti]|uniref:Putative electron transport protein SCO1/SenC n=1 Tax=Deinococcus deserti (strain DSM 17065 / CIP 109153 / LMG 22923 / VCD115) TaxID=546414 RepID=C1D3J0_DEIDV|nr:SCO family protein [Deinococcus deserti]ACO48069.1 putative electron transport protein SCO1/SenC, precursor [Deinococcus deserti VCD115]